MYSWLDGSILYDQDNDNDSITMDEDPNCTEISCSEINPQLVFNPGHEDADGDGDGDESHKEPESDCMLLEMWPHTKRFSSQMSITEYLASPPSFSPSSPLVAWLR